MKKVLSLLLAMGLALGVFTACGTEDPSSGPSEPQSGSQQAAARTTFRIAGLKGPTTLGMLQMMGAQADGTARHDYQVSVYGAADEIVPLLVKGELDAAMIPCNLAATLYQSTEGKVQVAAVNTLGVLYVVETGDNIHSVEDLRGKTIYTTGKGTTPEYTLRYILRENGIDPETDVDIQYKSEATEVLAAMQASSGYPIAMLPQPYVTTAQAKMSQLRIALDMTQEWDKVSQDSALVTGVLVVRTEFAQQNKAAFNELLEDYQRSISYVNDDTAGVAALSEQFDLFPAAVAQKAIPSCNITYMDGEEMKTKVAGYLKVLYEQNPKSVGGTLPDDAFYYEK